MGAEVVASYASARVRLAAQTPWVRVFGDERGPGEDLALQFEAVSQFTEHEKRTVRELLEGMILKHVAGPDPVPGT
jgi:hypothetical protein